MSINLLEKIQQNLGYPPLQKIDPNLQQETVMDHSSEGNSFAQAAIPAVLTGMYRLAQSDEGALEISTDGLETSWINKIFEKDAEKVINAIAEYGQLPGQDTAIKMNTIAVEAVKIIKENLAADASIKDVKIFLTAQKNNILLYLPPVLNIGGLLDDDSLDDNTNKMEGPVSSLIQSIGSVFSSPVTATEIKSDKAG
jgi:hypothetical protein